MLRRRRSGNNPTGENTVVEDSKVIWNKTRGQTLACNGQSARASALCQPRNVLPPGFAQCDPPFRELQFVFAVREVVVIFNNTSRVR
jgi:hypothetical protein